MIGQESRLTLPRLAAHTLRVAPISATEMHIELIANMIKAIDVSANLHNKVTKGRPTITSVKVPTTH